ncbi:putative protein kinase-like domain superfamily [Helianthus debilis subsp. tardiflorus]
MKGKSGQDHLTAAATVTPTGDIGVGSGSGVAPPPMAAHKKESGSVKPQADKKKTCMLDENMLLDKTRIVKIVDFGLARVEASNPNDISCETGTLGYMPLRG